MGILSSIFKSRDKPENRTAGSGYSIFPAFHVCFPILISFLSSFSPFYDRKKRAPDLFSGPEPRFFIFSVFTDSAAPS